MRIKVRRTLGLAALLLVAVLASACGGAGATDASVTGTVTYLARMSMAPGTVITVQIQDTSRADAAATVIGEQVIEITDQQVPVPYEVGYNSADIVEANSYTMSARITDANGNLMFINDTSIPVITRGNPTTDVEIMTVPVGG